MAVTLESIRAARERIRGAVYESPCPYSLTLSRLCGCEVYCKFDHLQMTGSFKERGARNKLMLLPEARRRSGVIAASAGNHALGLAYHGQLLSVPVTVVMPKWAPMVKVSMTRSFGANVILHGETFDDAYQEAKRLAGERGLTFVPGFDDEDIMAGQGTLGLEVLEQVPDVDAIFVPVGGGGLIAGVGVAVKALKPSVKVIGVEAVSAQTLKVSLEKGEVTGVATSATLADGLAVKQIGGRCFEIIKPVLDDLVVVDELDSTLNALRNLNLSMPCLNTSVTLVTPAPDRWQMMLDECQRYATLASGTGTRFIRVFGGSVPNGLSRDEARALAQRHLRQLVKICRVHNCQPLLETHDAWSTSDEALELLHEFDPADAAVIWDFEHAVRRGEDPASSATRLAKYIRHVHVKDSSRAGDAYHSKLLGEGDLPLPAVFAALKSIGYDAFLCLETEKRWHPDAPDPERSIPQFADYVRTHWPQ